MGRETVEREVHIPTLHPVNPRAAHFIFALDMDITVPTVTRKEERSGRLGGERKEEKRKQKRKTKGYAASLIYTEKKV
jgi:hypothetical protein